MLYCLVFTLKDPIGRFQHLGVNLRTVQRILKELKESNDDYKGMTAQKPQSDHSNKKRTEFLSEIQAMIDSDPIKSIRSIAMDIGVSEFLRNIVHEDIQYFSYRIKKSNFFFFFF